MNNKICISTQGGAASLGSIVQGNGNQVCTVASASTIDQSSQAAQSAISALGNELELSFDKINGAIDQLQKLTAESRMPKPEPIKAVGILNTIKENYSWAYPIVKDFLSVAWPAVLALVA